MNVKIRKGDTVEIIAGKDKNKRGEVIKVMPGEKRLVVQGANMRRKHQRQVQAGGRNMAPGIIEYEGSLDISNVMLVCPKCDEITRVAIRRGEDGSISRVCKNCDQVID